MNNLVLSTVTLCSVDTRTPLLALAAMERSMRRIRFADAVLFSHVSPELLSEAKKIGVRVVDPGPIDSVDAYSRFMMQGLLPHAKFTHVLVVQWDGFVLSQEAWDDEFLKYDYIGAIWPERMARFPVGNGGFSLRSVKLLRALMADEIKVTHPEDVSICDVNRAALENGHGIRFATSEVAGRFAYEHVMPSSVTFGFHGVFNLANVMDAKEILSLVEKMSDDMYFAAGMRTLAKTLMRDGQYDAAQRILMGRVRGGDRRWRTLSLLLRLNLRRLSGMPQNRFWKIQQ